MLFHNNPPKIILLYTPYRYIVYVKKLWPFDINYFLQAFAINTRQSFLYYFNLKAAHHVKIT